MSSTKSGQSRLAGLLNSTNKKMVTNINLVSPEVENKNKLSGKTALVSSVLLLVMVTGTYIALRSVRSHYSRQEKDLSQQVEQTHSEIAGPNYEALADFQQRLILLGKIMDNHVYFESYLRNFSKYVLPEVRLLAFSWEGQGNKIEIKGIAPNFDVLSKELILLRGNDSIQSVELKSAKEVTATGTQQGGLNFDLAVTAKKDAFKK